MPEKHTDITIGIDGRSYATRDNHQKAETLLRLAGLDPNVTDLAEAMGDGDVKTYRDEQNVQLHDGDEFVSVPQGIEVIVNGQLKIVPSGEISFSDAVELAYPDKVADPNLTFVVLFRKAAEPKEGTMPEGGKITAKPKGTIINVTFTNKS
jgi:hypothetical protein